MQGPQESPRVLEIGQRVHGRVRAARSAVAALSGRVTQDHE